MSKSDFCLCSSKAISVRSVTMLTHIKGAPVCVIVVPGLRLKYVRIERIAAIVTIQAWADIRRFCAVACDSDRPSLG
jgi:hypothetical protein